jgi:hypothetical protein
MRFADKPRFRNVAAQIAFAAWLTALTLVFFLTQTPTTLTQTILKAPRLAVLADWRTSLLTHLSAKYQQ